MTSLWQLKRFEARIPLFKSLDCPLALAAAGMNQRFTRFPPVINHNLGWCNWGETYFVSAHRGMFIGIFTAARLYIGAEALEGLPIGHKFTLKTFWRPVFKTGLQDGYEDLKKLTDPSCWRRIFKVPKTSILDVLQPKFNAPFKTSIQVVLNTTKVRSSKRWCNG